MGIMFKTSVALIGASVLLATASAANASTIYSQTFSSGASGVLTGTAPTVDNGGATWQLAGATGDDWSASGVAPTSSGGGYLTAAEYLPLTVASGNIYTLSVGALTPVTGTTGNWLAVGFFNSTSNNFILGSTTQGPFMLLRDNGEIQAFGGPLSEAASFNTGNAGNGAGPYSLGGTATVVLNTEGTNWTASFSYGGTSLGTYTYTTNPSASLGVGFLSYKSMQGSVGSISLTATPEPASFALAGLGLGGMLLLKKRVAR